ncbi:MAG: bifunctional phosphopantothenoylcysteine decarboxylase/phosphopantothenate--cysteine ligase CoaBC, partial [Chloroflexota bacterium]
MTNPRETPERPRALAGKHVVLGVTGSIAAYKAAEIASKLTQMGALVDAVLTPSAKEFIGEATFAGLTHRPVSTGLFEPKSELGMDHVALARRADILLIAPATANTIAKLAFGVADDVITATALATQVPVLIAPAMDAHMYDAPSTQANVEMLSHRGCAFAGPAEGRMASGLSGRGRMLEPAEIIGHVRMTLGRDGDLAGRRVVVSAGGTQEPLDPVRVITNHSSGKMGYAVAEAARDRGASVTLVSAPTALPRPVGIEIVSVTTAAEMADALSEACDRADALIMAAAVSDYRPATRAEQKMKRLGSDGMALELVQNPDILAGINGERLVKVAFAAETEELVENAGRKLASKGASLVVANDVTAEGSGFGSDTNAVTFIRPGGEPERMPLMRKTDVADALLD